MINEKVTATIKHGDGTEETLDISGPYGELDRFKRQMSPGDFLLVEDNKLTIGQKVFKVIKKIIKFAQ